jgi:hypothetical protein
MATHRHKHKTSNVCLEGQQNSNLGCSNQGGGEMYKFLIIENVLKCIPNLGKFEQVSKRF